MKKQLNKYNFTKIGIHILFWIAILLVFILFYGQKKGSYFTVLYQLAITMPVYIFAAYFTIYYIIPQFLLTKQYVKAVVYFIYLSLATIFVELIIIIYGMFVVTWPAGSIFAKMRPTYIDAYSLIAGIHFVIVLAAAIKILLLWYDSQNRYKELERKKIEAELQFLKAQMHPHFLFNTLNNLYALTLKKSDTAPEVVLKISSILDYILYQCNDDRVDLGKEIKLIEDYIDLEKLRCADRCDVSFDISGNVETVKVMPLIFLPFVENAFKHGVAINSEKSYVKISIDINQNKINFTIENSYKDNPETINTGIGIKNVKSRLEAGYPGKYRLAIEPDDGVFAVRLILEIGQ